MDSASPDVAQLKSNLKASWMAGDFGPIANYAVEAGEDFVARTEIKPIARVLDVACGTGNAAVAAARAGGSVTGVDIAPNLLEQARKRVSRVGEIIACRNLGKALRETHAAASQSSNAA